MKNLFLFISFTLLTLFFLSSCNTDTDNEIFDQEILIDQEIDLVTRLAESDEFKNYSILRKQFSNTVYIEVLSNPDFSVEEFTKNNALQYDIIESQVVLLNKFPSIVKMNEVDQTRIFDQAHKIALAKDEKFRKEIYKNSEEIELLKGRDVTLALNELRALLDCTDCFSASGCSICNSARITLDASLSGYENYALETCGTRESALRDGFELGDQFIEDWYSPRVRMLVAALLTGLASETGPAAPVIGASGAIIIEEGTGPLVAITYGLAQEACMWAVAVATLHDADVRDALFNLQICCLSNPLSCCS